MSADGIEAIAALSARLGRDPLLVQGGGGNASIKIGDTLWVKASGKWLAHAEREDIFVPVGLAAVRADIAADAADPVSAHVLDGAALRPSIETTLHALLPHRVVVHVHSIGALAAAVRRDGEARAAERLGGLGWRWLPYCRPGLPLTRAIAALGTPAPSVVLLANHGLVVGAHDAGAAERLIREVEARLATEPRNAPLPDRDALAREAAHCGMRIAPMPRVHDLGTDALSVRHARAGPLFPDQLVFLGASLDSEHAPHPAFRIVPGRGVLTARDITPGQVQMLLCLALLYQRLDAAAPLAVLDAHEAAAIMGWEAERYRVGLDVAQRR
jgi:rhamnose utilization protein RhaD (predicted bifunctional aldolase and dehydrogenase)